MRTLIPLGLAGLLAATAGPATAAALTQPAAGRGCITEAGAEGCAAGRALDGLADIAMSRDGRHVYAVAQLSRAVAVLSRSRRTGVLRQPPGSAGCVSDLTAGCRAARNLAVARAAAISRDDRFLYVATDGGLAVFARRRDGSLRQLPGERGCVREDGALGCATARAVHGGRAVTLSPDGRTVYASGLSSAVSIFRRNPSTGALTQLRGARGCIEERTLAPQGCARGRGLVAGRSLLAVRDRLYAGSLGVGAVPAAVAVFERGRRGALRQLAGGRGCLNAAGTNGCARVRGLLGVHDIVPRPGRRALYVAGSTDPSDGGIAVLALRRGARLRQPAGPRGCFTPDGSSGCTPMRGLLGAHTLTFSRDGRSAYVTSEVAAGTLAVLRGRRRLRQPRGGRWCLNADGAEGCSRARALRGAHQALLSRDERHVYVAALFGDGVVALHQNGRR